MGQPIVVVQKPSSTKGVLRFEINRSLTGMGHEAYASAAAATGDRPPSSIPDGSMLITRAPFAS